MGGECSHRCASAASHINIEFNIDSIPSLTSEVVILWKTIYWSLFRQNTYFISCFEYNKLVCASTTNRLKNGTFLSMRKGISFQHFY